MSIDVSNIRKQFPTLSADAGMVYLDTAATSLTPEPVLAAMDRYYRTYRANTHRGLYRSAEQATDAYEMARKKVASCIGAAPGEVVFTGGATAASNMLVYGLEQTLDLTEGDEVVTTVLEHHEMLLPVLELARRKKLVVKYAQLSEGFSVDLDDLRSLVSERTKIIAVTAASNVTGRMVDSVPGVEQAVVIRDVTARIGHMPVRIQDLGADFAFFSGHKMCGPTGIGVLYGREDLLKRLQPGFFGGGMVDDVTLDKARWCDGVERFEAGSQNIAGAIGLGAAVDFLEHLGLDAVHTHVRKLADYAFSVLGAIDGVTLYAAPSVQNVGIVSFTLDSVHPHDVAQVCADAGVAVRAGHHCALPLHKELGLSATVRASLYVFNTTEDIDALGAAVVRAHALFAAH